MRRCAPSPSSRLERSARLHQPRGTPAVADLPGRVRPARACLPDARARRAAGRARARGHVRDVVALARARGGGRDASSSPAPEHPVFSGPEHPPTPYEAVALAAPRRRAVRSPQLRADVVVHDILTLAPAMAAELEGVPVATLVPHLYPVGAPGFPPYALGARLPRTAAGRAALAAARAPARARIAAGSRRAQRDPPPARAAADRRACTAGISTELCIVGTLPAARVPA